MIDYEPKVGESVTDTIVKLLNKGHSRSDIYDFMEHHCSMMMTTTAHRISMIDHIEKLSAINVFGIGGNNA